MKSTAVLLALLLAFVLVGCGSTSTDSSVSQQPTFLHVTRTNMLYHKPLPPFKGTIRDSAEVQSLYKAALSLPVVSGVVNCPLDLGVVYHLQFFQDSTAFQDMSFDVTGCDFLHISQVDARFTTTSFQSLFMKIIGIPSLMPLT